MRSRTFVLAAAAMTAACSPPPVQKAPTPLPVSVAPPPAPVVPLSRTTASATLRDLVGTRVGTATFTDSPAGVIVVASVTGIGLGAHAVHIHETGKCVSPFATAGGAGNPGNRHHGFQNSEGPHLGDLPNIDMPAAGLLRFEFLMPGVSLKGRNALLDGDGSAI